MATGCDDGRSAPLGGMIRLGTRPLFKYLVLEERGADWSATSQELAPLVEEDQYITVWRRLLAPSALVSRLLLKT